MTLGSTMHRNALCNLTEYSANINGISNVGTVKDPTIYHISTAWLKYNAIIIAIPPVIINPKLIEVRT